MNTEVKHSPSIYSFISPLVTTYQMDIEDWDLGPMSRKNYRAINKRIEDHNESLKILAVSLKAATELAASQFKEQLSLLQEENERLKKLNSEKKLAIISHLCDKGKLESEVQRLREALTRVDTLIKAPEYHTDRHILDIIEPALQSDNLV